MWKVGKVQIDRMDKLYFLSMLFLVQKCINRNAKPIIRKKNTVVEFRMYL